MNGHLVSGIGTLLVIDEERDGQIKLWRGEGGWERVKAVLAE